MWIAPHHGISLRAAFARQKFIGMSRHLAWIHVHQESHLAQNSHSEKRTNTWWCHVTNLFHSEAELFLCNWGLQLSLKPWECVHNKMEGNIMALHCAGQKLEGLLNRPLLSSSINSSFHSVPVSFQHMLSDCHACYPGGSKSNCEEESTRSRCRKKSSAAEKTICRDEKDRQLLYKDQELAWPTRMLMILVTFVLSSLIMFLEKISIAEIWAVSLLRELKEVRDICSIWSTSSQSVWSPHDSLLCVCLAFFC